MTKRQKRRSVKDKPIAQTLHTKRRLRERYGITLKVCEIRELAVRIKNPAKQPEESRPVFLARQSVRLTVWAVPFGGNRLILVYDGLRGTITTALPPGTGLRTPIVFKEETYGIRV